MDTEHYDCLGRAVNMSKPTLDTTFSTEDEKQVLVSLYHATGGHRWCNNTGWLNPGVHHCLWYGITCYDDVPYVKTIQLAFNNLNGSLPRDLWKLRNLLALCPNDNLLLGGQLEDVIHSNMSKLVTISIRRTSYSGNIPKAITKLVHLQTFLACEMNGEKLSGPLPTDLGNMAELRVLGIGGNRFNGSIPRSITQLSKLQYLDLQNVKGLLSGHLNDLLSLKSMQSLYVSGLALGGTFPHALPCKLGYLFLPGNQIRGKLPTEFECKEGNNLLEVNLSNNNLSGSIPRIFFTAEKLQYADFSNNHLKSFKTSKNSTFWPDSRGAPLLTLVLAGNKDLSFDIESLLAYTMPSNLKSLNLNNCGIQGRLPELVWNTGLLTLDLGNNRLFGDIPPADVADDVKMMYLDLSNNNLTGSIPNSIYSATTLRYFNITGNAEMSDGGKTGHEMDPAFLVPDYQNMYRARPSHNFTCPEVHFTFNDGHVYLDPSYYDYRFCVCDDGYYGVKGVCAKCMSGAICSKPKVKGWKDLNRNTMIMNTGFWPMPLPGTVSHLRQCLFPEACNPTGDCSCWLQPTTRNTQCNKSCLCSSGSTARFCSKCLDGFYKRGQTCSKCEKDQTKFYISVLCLVISAPIYFWTFSYKGFHPLAAYAALFIHGLLMVILMILGILRGWVFGLSLFVFIFVVIGRRDELQPLIKIATFYMQLLDSMISSANVWPNDIISTQHYFSGLWNLHFSDISCDFAIFFTPVGKMLSMLLLPIGCIILTWVYYAAARICGRFRRPTADTAERAVALNFKCRRITITILNFAYFPIVAATISSITPCEKDSSISFMPSLPWVQCPSGTHTKLVFMGWTSLLLYVLGVPCFIFLPALLKNRGIIKDVTSLEGQELEKWLGPLFSSYSESCRWFYEILLLTRRLALAFILSFLKVYPSWQTLMVCCVLTVALVVHLLMKPFKPTNSRFHFENTLETIVLVVLLNSFGALRFVESDPVSSKLPIVSLVIGANVLVIAGFIFTAAFLICSSSRSHQGYEML